MAHINSRRFHSVAITGEVITKNLADEFTLLHTAVENSIEARQFVTVNSNNPFNRFEATSGDVVTILILTMSPITKPTITVLPFNIPASVDVTAAGGVWKAEFTVPNDFQANTYLDFRVEYTKENQGTPSQISYVPIEHNQIKLVSS